MRSVWLWIAVAAPLALAAALSVGIASGQEPPPPDVTVPAVQSVSADPSVLWPPNHKMRTVTVSAVVTDDTDPAPTWAITGVTSNEPEAGPGADKSPDCVITGPNTVQLRAERLGNGSGRIYTITITASDASGNTATATVEVTVPHDKGKKK